MAFIKTYWRPIVFGLVCLTSVGMGGWALMAGSDIEAKMKAVDRIRTSVESAGRTPANRAVIEAREKQIERENAEFERSMSAALALQRLNAFESQVRSEGTVEPAERKTLIDNVLPKPRGSADAIAFKRAYVNAFSQLTKRLRARGKPTEREVVEYAEQFNRLRSGADIGGENNPWWSSVDSGSTEDHREDRGLRPLDEVLREYPRSRIADEIARTIWMYVDPGAIRKSGAARMDGAPSEVDIWHAQMSLWIQQDMVVALARCNESRAAELREAGRKEDLWVAHMPVKHLKTLAIDSKLGKGGGSNRWTFPEFTVTDIKNDSKKFVVPIGLHLVVEEASITKILDEICRVGFYTPLEIGYGTVDPVPLQDTYVYGDDPIVELKITLEGYYFREVFDQWIPKSLDKILATPGAKDPQAGR